MKKLYHFSCKERQYQTATVSVTVNSAPTVSITSSGTALTCANPTVSLLASGGDTYRWEDNSTNATRSVSTAGTYSVTATTANGCWATASATIVSNTAVISITNPITTTATTGSFFSQTFSVTGGISPYSFSLASGNLPASLMLSATGILSGTPTLAGSYSITVQVTDANGCSGVSATYILVISQEGPCGAVVYVTQQGAGSQDGTSWTNAFSGTALQTAINTATNCGAQVWVAQGLYKPTSTTDRTISFAMRNNIAIYGGFVGTEASLNQRPVVNISTPSSTTLSGDIDNDGTLSNNSYHVISNPRGLTPNAILDGFMITGGNADGDSNGMNNLGGGLYNNGSGSGQFCHPTLRNCFFQGNVSSRGGAIYNDARGGISNPQISNCLFLNNSATGGGGAIWNAGNVNGNSSPRITNCLFQNNSADFFGGGAIYNDAEVPGISSPQLINCSFLNNSATRFGGAIWNGALGGTSSPQLTNCSFQGNSSVGGVIYSRSNTSGSSTPQLTNCVFFNNGSGNVFVNSSATVTASYSLFGPNVTEYISGPGNLTTTTSPFAGTATTQLAGYSPALNVGLNSATSLMGITTDLAGNPRRYNTGTVDMGAYEYQGDPTTITVSNPSVSTAVQGRVFSQAFTASGGTGTYSYSLAGGTLPTGLNLGSTGVLSGTPTQAGSFLITVQATDASGCLGVGATYTLNIEAMSTITPVAWVSSDPLTAGSATGSISLSASSGAYLPGSPVSVSYTTPGATTALYTGSTTASGEIIISDLVAGTYGPFLVSVNGSLPSAPSNVVTLTDPVPDLAPILYALPSTVTGNKPISVVISVMSLASTATRGPITIRLTKDAKVSLSLPPNATQVGGRPVQNGKWQFSDTDLNCYVLTTSEVIAEDGMLSVGLEGILTPGGTKGRITLSVVVSAEGETRLINNMDAEIIDYFQH